MDGCKRKPWKDIMQRRNSLRSLCGNEEGELTRVKMGQEIPLKVTDRCAEDRTRAVPLRRRTLVI